MYCVLENFTVDLFVHVSNSKAIYVCFIQGLLKECSFILMHSLPNIMCSIEYMYYRKIHIYENITLRQIPGAGKLTWSSCNLPGFCHQHPCDNQ